MTAAGHNALVQWWRYNQDPDDYVGGSIPTGTMLRDGLGVRIEPVTPTMALLEQGLETLKLFETAIGYDARGIEENDILLVYEPQDSQYYLYEFRVISVQYPSLRANDPRSQIQLIMRRWEKAHARQV